MVLVWVVLWRLGGWRVVVVDDVAALRASFEKVGVRWADLWVMRHAVVGRRVRVRPVEICSFVVSRGESSLLFVHAGCCVSPLRVRWAMLTDRREQLVERQSFRGMIDRSRNDVCFQRNADCISCSYVQKAACSLSITCFTLGALCSEIRHSACERGRECSQWFWNQPIEQYIALFHHSFKTNRHF